MISGGGAFRHGNPRIYFFAGAGPGAFRTLEGEWTTVLAANTGVVFSPVGRTIVRAGLFGAYQREWLMKGVKIGFGFRL